MLSLCPRVPEQGGTLTLSALWGVGRKLALATGVWGYFPSIPKLDTNEM